ncbi:MAG: hypothetical protein BMS9Abin05_0287 [Rhodothermia bacterium]|nr:MAG: hypothetical protein BMS9Abin05_0287 [Rhodothermia bacterium]
MSTAKDTFLTDLPAEPPGIQAGLDEYLEPLDRARAAHLLRRTSMFGTAAEVSALIGRTAGEVVDELILNARVAPHPDDPPWADSLPPGRDAPSEVREAYNRDNNSWVKDFRREWVGELYTGGLREKVSLFWHDHFVTEIQTYRYAVYAHRYLKLLRTNSLQYFKTFVRRVGLDSSMLIYLNGDRNRSGKPNENYARELLELFTMSPQDENGQDNYSEDDIKEIARALTGWVISPTTGNAVLDPERYDPEPKTIFGFEDSFDYHGVVDLLFDQKGAAIANYIAQKIYALFVYDQPDTAVVAELAQELLNSDFAIFSTMGSLLKSQHFFDPGVFGTKIKDPVEFTIQLARSTGREPTEDMIEYLNHLIPLIDQELFNPPGVDGWPGYHDWISTSSLPMRWVVSDVVLLGSDGDLPPVNLQPMAAELHDANDPEAAFYLPAAIAEHLFAVDLASVDIPELPDEFGGDLDSNPIPDAIQNGPAHIRNLSKIFLGGAPWYEWYLYNPGSNERLLGFVRLLIQYPDYQLM